MITQEQADKLKNLSERLSTGNDLWAYEAMHRYIDSLVAAAPTPSVQQDDEALEALRLALNALTCGDTGDDHEDSHRCSYCDEYVDRNGPIRQRIRALLAKRGADEIGRR